MTKQKEYSPSEAAKKLKISRSAVHEAIRDGRLKASYKIKRVRVYSIQESDLKTYEVSSSHQARGKKIK